MIVALAGHVDHGKTALVRALTGIDPDRLPDEKARGMTIDLGFAHSVLPGGETVGFVDVPGHERFLTNMLAGVLSIDSVLLVVAADDGPMPQTHEHLAVLALTGITDVAVAITKIDRVDAPRVAEVAAEVRAVLARAGYADPEVVPVSAIVGTGMATLRAWIAAKAATWQRRSAEGGFRLAIDRGFLVPGTGLVVTGTVASGSVALGDRLLLSPLRLAARVRGIQVHHATAETASAGDRCALAIAGTRIEKATVRRGDWLVAPALHVPTMRLDVEVRVLEGRTLKHASSVHVHIGSASIRARVLTAGDNFAHLTLQRETGALFGDRVILRDDTTGRVVAGGRVIDPFPPTRRVAREQRTAALQAMASADPLNGLLRTNGWVDLARFAVARNLTTTADLSGGIRIGRPAHPILISDVTNDSLGQDLLNTLKGWHNKHPDLPGPGKALLLSSLRAWPAEIAEAVLLDRLARGDIQQRDAVYHLPGHQARLTVADAAAWKRIEPAIAADPLRPPRVREIAELMAIAPESAEALLVRLERFGLLLRVAANRFYSKSGIIALSDIASVLTIESEEGTFNAAAFNKRSGIGRNLTIQVLEYMDKIGVSYRSGEQRHVVRAAADVLG
ncbi:MAG: selenocysteine-specific translation elongation factor [Rhodospirillales bacterium]